MIGQRIKLLLQLKSYMETNDTEWAATKQKAIYHNGWFIPEFIESAEQAITHHFLDEQELNQYAKQFQLSSDKSVTSKKVGLVMAGNIPLVGFHDFLNVFLSGYQLAIKFSSKDQILLPHLIEKLYEWSPDLRQSISSPSMLKGCDAYISTGSNNSSRIFEYYFKNYPHILRKNRTSVAILNGKESEDDLNSLSDDIFQYFGLGCRNVTKLFVPKHYDFVPILTAFRKYEYLKDHPKYKNNLDYNLAIMMLNNQYYMSSGNILLIEQSALFSPISVLGYEYYDSLDFVIESLQSNNDLQSIVGEGFVPFGKAQHPGLYDYADGVDTIAFLNSI